MRRGIIYIDDKYAEYGYIDESPDNIHIISETGCVECGISYEALKEHLGFDYYSGYYVIGSDKGLGTFPFGRDAFPYNLDKHNYNTKFVEDLFKDKQKTGNNINFRFIEELPYTFGLEFETAGGYLPQHRLYELGLIPLRDGSITGIEFSTVVLQGNLGLNLLKQQLEALNKHTIFDKDCSLHIHFGGFKLDGEVLIRVNNLFAGSNLKDYLPKYTFNTTAYKTNQNKNYCAYNSKYTNFLAMYKSLVGRSFYGDFKQPHPHDLSGTRKWNINERYKAINFINALCYDGPKTIEYRMLRPTYNFDKILGWLFVYGALIKFAENIKNSPGTFCKTGIPIEHIIRSVYSSELAEILCKFMDAVARITHAQHSVGDMYGMRIDIDDKLINYQSFGHYFY